jgi:hypothetical protein
VKLSATFVRYFVEKSVDYFGKFSEGLQRSLLTYNDSVSTSEVNSYLSTNNERTTTSAGGRHATHAHRRAWRGYPQFRVKKLCTDSQFSDYCGSPVAIEGTTAAQVAFPKGKALYTIFETPH